MRVKNSNNLYSWIVQKIKLKNKISWNKFSCKMILRYTFSNSRDINNMFYDFLCRRTGLDPRDKKRKADVKDIEQKIQSTSFVEFYGDFRLQEPFESRLLELVKHYYLQFQRKDTNIKPTEFNGPMIVSEQIQTSEFIIQEKVYVYQLTSSLDLNLKEIIKQYPDLDVQIFVLDPKANGFNLEKNKQIKKYSTKLGKYKKYQHHNPGQVLSVYINYIPDQLNFKNQIPPSILNQDGLNFLTQKYPGINEPGVWFRMKDSWQKAKQDRSHLCVINWNHGPGTLVWYSIEFNQISQYKDPSLLEKDHIWFIKDANFFLNQNLPFRVTYQRPNDLIIIGAGNIFWNYALDDLFCSEWNYLSLNQFSLEVFVEKVDENQERKQKSIIPMINLLIDINLHQKNESIDQFLKSAIQDEIKVVSKDDLALKYLKQYCDNRIIFCKKCKSEPIIFYQIIDNKINYCVNCLDLSVTTIVLGARYINNLYDSFNGSGVIQCHQKICRKLYIPNKCQIVQTKLNKLEDIVEKNEQSIGQISVIKNRDFSYAYKIRIDQMKQIFREKEIEYYKRLNKKMEGTLDLIKSIILNVEGYRQIEYDLSNGLDEQKEWQGEIRIADLLIPQISHEKYAYLLRNFSDHEAIFQFYQANSSVNHFTKFIQEIEGPWWEEEYNEFENKWKKLTQGQLKRAIRWHDEIDFELQLILDGSSDQQNSLQQQKSISQKIQLQKDEISKQFDDQNEQQNDSQEQHKLQYDQLDKKQKQQDSKPKRRGKKQKDSNNTRKNKKLAKLTIKTRRQKILDQLNDPTEHVEHSQKKQSIRISERVDSKNTQKKVRLFF